MHKLEKRRFNLLLEREREREREGRKIKIVTEGKKAGSKARKLFPLRTICVILVHPFIAIVAFTNA